MSRANVDALATVVGASEIAATAAGSGVAALAIARRASVTVRVVIARPAASATAREATGRRGALAIVTPVPRQGAVRTHRLVPAPLSSNAAWSTPASHRRRGAVARQDARHVGEADRFAHGSE